MVCVFQGISLPVSLNSTVYNALMERGNFAQMNNYAHPGSYPDSNPMAAMSSNYQNLQSLTPSSFLDQYGNSYLAHSPNLQSLGSGMNPASYAGVMGFPSAGGYANSVKEESKSDAGSASSAGSLSYYNLNNNNGYFYPTSPYQMAQQGPVKQEMTSPGDDGRLQALSGDPAGESRGDPRDMIYAPTGNMATAYANFQQLSEQYGLRS